MYRATCDESIYKDNKLLVAVNELLEETKDMYLPSEQQGLALTTVGSDYNILHREETHNLAHWIISQILSIDEYKSKNSVLFDFTRHWANRIYSGCSGLCHTHTSTVDGVAIFYLDVPQDGSELVVINNGTDDSNYLDYDSSDRNHIKVESGTLLIHKPNVPHAVSIHNSTDSRTCLIFEFIIAEE